MERKKIDSIMKGVAVAGIVVGGAGVVADSDLVYAAEVEETDNSSNDNVEESTMA